MEEIEFLSYLHEVIFIQKKKNLFQKKKIFFSKKK